MFKAYLKSSGAHGDHEYGLKLYIKASDIDSLRQNGAHSQYCDTTIILNNASNRIVCRIFYKATIISKCDSR